jgi:hypothetical protein
VRQAV